MPPAPKKVLVGDGDAIVLALTCHILNRQGFAAFPIADRTELFRLIREGDFDAILLDAHLDGAIDLVKTTDRAQKIILTTPAEHPIEGVYATLRKPLEFAELIATVRRCTTKDE